MRLTILITSVGLTLISHGICQADTLVITYKSGKTQTFVLDEPSQGINSWQFVEGQASQQKSISPEGVNKRSIQEPVQKDISPQSQTDVKGAEKPSEKKKGIRVNWNAKPIAD